MDTTETINKLSNYASPFDERAEAKQELIDKAKEKDPSFWGSLLGSTAGSLAGAATAYPLGRLAGRFNDWVPNVMAKRLAKSNDPEQIAKFYADNASEAKKLRRDLMMDPEPGFLGAAEDFMRRAEYGSRDAMSSSEKLKLAYKDLMGLNAAGFGGLGGMVVGDSLGGQALGQERAGTNEAIAAIEALNNLNLDPKKKAELQKQLNSHFEQIEENKGSTAASILANVATTIPLAVAMKHPQVFRKVDEWIPDEKLADSNLVSTPYGKVMVSDFGADMVVGAPLGAAVGSGVYEATKGDNYKNPF